MKKIISILVTLVLALQMTVVFATGTPNVALSSATGKAGETVTITLDLANCDEWTNVGVQIKYDTAKFALNIDGIVNNATASGANMSKAKTYNTTYDRFNMSWTAGENSTYNGRMATLQFTIASDVAPGTYPINLSYFTGNKNNYVDGVKVNYLADENNNKTPLGLTYTSGSITVEAPAPAGPTLNATCADGKNVVITATADEFEGKFIAALYDGIEMTDMVIADAVPSTTLTFLEGTGNNVKVFWWDGLDTLVPVAGPVEIVVGNN